MPLMRSLGSLTDGICVTVIIASSNTATGNISNAGRVVRLVRLVKFVRLYRLWMERRRIQQYDEFLQELILMNEIDLAEV